VTKDFYIYNGGNETLTVESINFDSGDTVFSYQGGSTCIAVMAAAISGAELAPGQICMFPVTMNAPHGGTFTGTVIVATNSLNNSSTTQIVAAQPARSTAPTSRHPRQAWTLVCKASTPPLR